MTYLVECDQGLDDLATGLFRVFAQFEYWAPRKIALTLRWRYDAMDGRLLGV